MKIIRTKIIITIMKYKNLTKLKQCVILIILLNFITTVTANKKYNKSFDKVLKKIDGKW